jgi:hypothetical protein
MGCAGNSGSAAVEPVIGHLKSDHRLNRDYPKGFLGDRVKLLMAAIVFNFRKLMRAVILSPQGIKRIIVWMMKPDTQRHECSCVWLLQGRLPASTSKDRQVRY